MRGLWYILIVQALRVRDFDVARIAFCLQGWFVVVILFFSTLAFGGFSPEAVYAAQLLILVTLILQVFLFCSNHRINFRINFYTPFLFFFAFVVFVFLQSFFGTVHAYVTRQSLIQLIYYFLFFTACLQIVSRREWVERLVSLIALLTFTVVVLGLVQRLAGTERILWKYYLSSTSAFFGPFINENHFGGFLGLTFPLLLGLMHYRFNKVKQKTAYPRYENTRLLTWFEFLNSGSGFLFFLIVVTLAASFYSLARLSSIVLLLCCFIYFVVYGIKKGNMSFYLILILILGGSLLLLWRLGFDLGTSHLTFTDFQKAWHIRSEIAKQSLALFREFPFFGTGLGTYRFISSKAVSYLINEVSYHHAENDFVELLIETGMVGLSLFLAPLVIILFLALKRIRRDSSPWNQFIVIQAATSLLCIGMMECFDFHLKIPANALFFTLQLALLCQSFVSYGSSSFFSKCFFAISALTLGGFLLFHSTNDYRAYRLSQINDNRLVHLKQAVALQSSNPRLWYELGHEFRKQAKTLAAGDGRALGLKQQAVLALRNAAGLNPADASYWYSLGTLEYSSDYPKEGIVSLEQAVYWAPHRLQYSIYLLGAYLRESEKTRSQVKKTGFLNKAKMLYNQLQSLEVKPRPEDYKVWMGEHDHKKLQQLTASW